MRSETIGNATLYASDCIAAMRTLADASIDAIVTDPPYELGFMGRAWDASGIAYSVEMWRECLRVLKPGGHLLAFSGSRTYHRMTVAIEDAGFDIRDQIMWLYGSGFPKSLDVSKAIDKAAGAVREVVSERPAYGIGANGAAFNGHADGATAKVTLPATDAAREWSGWGTALKPSHEPVCVARKPLIGTVAENVLKHGTGALNIDACRVGTEVITTQAKPKGASFTSVGEAQGFNGCEASEHVGRWPANVIHDGSPEVVAGFPVTTSGKPSGNRNAAWFAGAKEQGTALTGFGDTGSAARFFYTAKASSDDRDDGNDHPTVKPTALMTYLVRLVTAAGGVVLDPFTGSGSTGVAAVKQNRRFIGIERDPGYFEIARRRIDNAQRQGSLFDALLADESADVAL